MRRNILLAAAVLIAVALAALWWLTRPLPVLTVTTWPGDYGHAQAAAMMRPYAAKAHIDVHLAEYDGGLNELAAAVASHTYSGDVIDFELPAAVQACHRGLLEPVKAARLPPGADGTPAARDFVTGGIGPCWVGNVVYSQVLVYTPHRFGNAPPATLADFFNLAKFPGRRALLDGPKFNLEMALLADGVAPDDVYKTLDSPAGLARAFAKLSTIEAVTIWSPSNARNLDLVQHGLAAFGVALNGDIYAAGRRGTAPGVIWDHQLYELDVFGVPVGDPRKSLAMDYIRYATGSAPLARVAGWVPYGPARRSALALVGDNPELHQPMRAWLPTSHFDTAFAIDDEWWRANGPRIAARWRAWRGGALTAPAASP